MDREYLFCSGEFRVSMPLVFSKDEWSYTMNASKLVLKNGLVGRENIPAERLKGIIFFADMDDKELEKQNLETIINSNTICWQDPNVLLNLINRHNVLSICKKYGFVDHEIHQLKYNEILNKLDKFNYPVVLKVGNSHRGEGKHRAFSKQELEEVLEHIENQDDILTIEPFFKGDSVRVLVIDDHTFGIKVESEESWIKNFIGSEVSLIDVSDDMKNHAKSLSVKLGLDFAGVDYILEKNGNYHFLEINQYPGLDIDDSVEPIIKNALLNKMNYIKKVSNG